MDALIGSLSSNSLLEGNVNCIALFNHEEVGSVSSTGAESNLIPSVLSRLSPTPDLLAQSIASSFLVSCDMGHAIHPNYTNKHEENHQPRINGGVMIKTNAKQKYTSDAIGSFLVKKLVEKKGGKVQEYEARNDMYVLLCPDHSFYSDFAQAVWFNCWSLFVYYGLTGSRRRLPYVINAFHQRDCGDKVSSYIIW